MKWFSKNMIKDPMIKFRKQIRELIIGSLKKMAKNLKKFYKIQKFCRLHEKTLWNFDFEVLK